MRPENVIRSHETSESTCAERAALEVPRSFRKTGDKWAPAFIFGTLIYSATLIKHDSSAVSFTYCAGRLAPSAKSTCDNQSVHVLSGPVAQMDRAAVS
jgi:hypothetical protein